MFLLQISYTVHVRKITQNYSLTQIVTREYVYLQGGPKNVSLVITAINMSAVN